MPATRAPSAPAGPTASDLNTLQELNRQYVRSVAEADVGWFKAHRSEDFLNSNPDDSLADSASFLAQIAKPASISNLEAADVRIRVIGDLPSSTPGRRSRSRMARPAPVAIATFGCGNGGPRHALLTRQLPSPRRPVNTPMPVRTGTTRTAERLPRARAGAGGRGVFRPRPKHLRVAKIARRPHSSGVSNAPQIAEVAALVGDPARANILCALLGGRALTATELAFAAGVSPQTTSGHLGKLHAARLLALMKQGRHRYYRLAGPHVGQMLESIMSVALTGPPRFQPRSKLDERLRHARTCYDHIAGVLGVGISDRLMEQEYVILGDEAGEVTQAGADFLSRLGVDLSAARAKRRVFCRPCVDWTERRPHIGGAVGAALASRLFELKWIARVRDNRVLTITTAGRRGLRDTFGLVI